MVIELFKVIENSAKIFEIAQIQARTLQEKFQIRQSTEDESKFYGPTRFIRVQTEMSQTKTQRF